jgi:hypothetical protein
MWTFTISTGVLTDGTRTIEAYSGREGEWKNNPSDTDIVDYGPIPVGHYTIGNAFDDPIHGSIVMRLTPQDGTETFGRSGFLIHGDSRTHPGNASHGCIVTCGNTPHDDRKYIDASPDKDLEVVP